MSMYYLNQSESGLVRLGVEAKLISSANKHGIDLGYGFQISIHTSIFIDICSMNFILLQLLLFSYENYFEYILS